MFNTKEKVKKKPEFFPDMNFDYFRGKLLEVETTENTYTDYYLISYNTLGLFLLSDESTPSCFIPLHLLVNISADEQ